MAFPWSAGDQLNAADLDAVAQANLFSTSAAEAISAANKAVAAGYYQSDGGVKFDTSGKNDQNGGLSGTSMSVTITVGSNSNRILIAALVSSSGAGISSTLSAGAGTMSQIGQAGSGTKVTTYMLVAPATGSLTVTASSLTNGQFYQLFVFSYYNAAQSSQPNVHNETNGTTASSLGVTTTVDGCLVWGALGGGASNNVGSGITNNDNSTTHSTNAGSWDVGDQGIQIIAGGASLTTISGNSVIAIIAIAPATAPQYGYVLNASAANSSSYSTPTNSKIRSVAFLGFSQASASANQAMVILTSGVVGGFSGLTPFADYYLSDTPGAISTTPGTNSRKVGVALDVTHLVITNVW